MRHFRFRTALAALSLAALGACATPPAPVDRAALYAAALQSPNRSEQDRAQDERRKAGEVLAFFQAAPGQTVFEIEAGGGYWTELLASAVGPEGRVVMQNPPGFMQFVGEEVASRLPRLPTVRLSLSLFDALDAQDASVDLVTWVQGPHELYYRPEGASLGDPEKSYQEIFRILRPGGRFVVIDHAAVPGAPETTGNDLHRIDPQIVIAMAERAGFVLEQRSEVLANPNDARTLLVFDPLIRGHTDQFALRFSKPEA
ncbi:MAG: class I SAM-dependent methyltransferase [Caulobacterales bacterium]